MKRLFDILISFIGIIFISPFFILIMVLFVFNNGGPFFRQKRIGKNEKVFLLYKFRTMKDVDELKGLISNEQRVTKFGRFLRNFSIDEIPSLINILKGDMSLVGPRPLLVEYLPYYKEKHRARHQVRPGLTGLAQINGRNNTTWDKRLDFDVEYVNSHNFFYDLRIIGKTILKVIRKDDVESDCDLSIVRLDKDKSYNN